MLKQGTFCLAIKCHDEPYQVNNIAAGVFDWDLTIRNRSYTHEVRKHLAHYVTEFQSTLIDTYTTNMNEKRYGA